MKAPRIYVACSWNYSVSRYFSCCLLSDTVLGFSLFILHYNFAAFRSWSMKAVKEIYGKKTGKEIGYQDIFYILTIFLGSTTIQRVRKLFLDPNEMAASLRQGVKIFLSLPGIYIQNLVFEALKMCKTLWGRYIYYSVFSVVVKSIIWCLSCDFDESIIWCF